MQISHQIDEFFYVKFQASYKIYSQLLESCLRIYDLIKIVKLVEGVNLVIYFGVFLLQEVVKKSRQIVMRREDLDYYITI